MDDRKYYEDINDDYNFQQEIARSPGYLRENHHHQDTTYQRHKHVIHQGQTNRQKPQILQPGMVPMGHPGGHMIGNNGRSNPIQMGPGHGTGLPIGMPGMHPMSSGNLPPNPINNREYTFGIGSLPLPTAGHIRGPGHLAMPPMVSSPFSHSNQVNSSGHNYNNNNLHQQQPQISNNQIYPPSPFASGHSAPMFQNYLPIRQTPASGYNSHSNNLHIHQAKSPNNYNQPHSFSPGRSLKESMAQFISSETKQKVMNRSSSRNSSLALNVNLGNTNMNHITPMNNDSTGLSYSPSADRGVTGFSVGSPMVGLPKSLPNTYGKNQHPLGSLTGPIRHRSGDTRLRAGSLLTDSESPCSAGLSPPEIGDIGRCRAGFSLQQQQLFQQLTPPEMGTLGSPPNTSTINESKTIDKIHVSHQDIISTAKKMKFQVDDIVTKSITDLGELQEIVEYGHTEEFNDQKNALLDFAKDFCRD